MQHDARDSNVHYTQFSEYSNFFLYVQSDTFLGGWGRDWATLRNRALCTYIHHYLRITKTLSIITLNSS